MLKKEVKILGLSYSQSSSGAYIVVLSEIKGDRKLPIVIKPSDAQQIGLKMDGDKTKMPLTNELFKMITDFYSIKIKEVYIYSVIEGLFFTKVITTNGDNEMSFECSVGDGVCISIVHDCPLYVSKEVLDTSGIRVNDDGSTIETDDYIDDDSDYEIDIDDIDDDKSIEDLQIMMEDSIKNEEYEIAAKIRDKIEEMRKN